MFPAVITLLLGLLWVHPNSILQTDEASPISNDRCGIINSTFQGGEEIVYKVYYNWGIFWTTAGLVHFMVTETEDQYQVSVIGSTAGFYDNFYKVRDTFKTFLDKETLLPTKFIRVLKEGKYRRYNRFDFDQNQKMVTSQKGKDQASIETSQEAFTGCMHDIISILYHVRNMNFDTLMAGDTFPVEIYLEQKYPLEVKIIEKDVIQRVKGSGKFRTHVFQPQLIAGEVFKEKDQMSIYITADSNHVPVLIESPLSVGKMKAVLIDYKGLKYNLDARLKSP
jgi:Protein of unknown function (DUF3108)